LVGGFTYSLTPNLSDYDPNGGCGPFHLVSNFSPVPFSIPAKLLNSDGNAVIQLQSVSYPTLKVSNTNMVLKDDPLNPMDYYIVTTSQVFGDYNYQVIPVPRSVTPPAGISNFKLRIVNQASTQDPYGLTGPLTLTYADGTSVSAITSNIPSGVTTDFVELPYGSYNFRIFNQAGKELSQAVVNQAAFPAPTTINAFKPGGVYTLFINSNNIFITPCPGMNVSLNSFSIIADITPAVNASFARLQFINAIPGLTLSLKVDNTVLGNLISFKGHSQYGVFVQGSHHLTLQDGKGQVLAEQDIMLYPNDNISIWGYVKNGEPMLVYAANDLSNPNVGQQVRFLNLSTDIPYVTFTSDGGLFTWYDQTNKTYVYPDYGDTTSDASASQNLPEGVSITHMPYIVFLPNAQSNFGALYSPPLYPIRVYQSDIGPPAVIPGAPLNTVGILNANDFVANPAIYSRGNYTGIPANGEPGAYTVALVGSVNGASDTSGKARLLIVKHFN
jgi:hypothetical protein